MPQFNATDAIFFGFRVVKRDPLLMLALAALFSVLSVASALMSSPEAAADLDAASVAFEVRMQEIQATAATNPEQALPELLSAYGEILAALGRYLTTPSVLGFIIVGMLASLAAQGAILRALVRDRREGWVMGLQLGSDELKIFVVGLVVGVLTFLASIGAILALIVVFILFSVVNPALGVLVLLLGCVACILGVALLGVRFSAATPASVGEKKYVVFGSWRITKGRMWGLLGAYVILVFIVFVAGLAVFAVGSLVAPQAMGIAQGMTQLGDAEEMAAAYRSPGFVFVTVLISTLSVVYTAAWAGVGAYAYRMLGAAAGYPNAQPPEDGLPPAGRVTP